MTITKSKVFVASVTAWLLWQLLMRAMEANTKITIDSTMLTFFGHKKNMPVILLCKKNMKFLFYHANCKYQKKRLKKDVIFLK